MRSVLGLLLLVGCRPTPAPAAPQPGEFAFSLATYNINFGTGHRIETVAAIAALDADVVFLQETTPDSEASLREAFEDEYPEIRFHHCCRAGGLGILSRFPILDDKILEPRGGFFPAWWARFDTPRGELVGLNVHLRPPISDGGSWVSGYFTTRDDRASEMGSLWMRLPKDAPVIIAGDFNENAKGRALKLLHNFGYQSVLPRFDRRATTWHWPIGATELRMMLDHIVVATPLSPTTAEVHQTGVSDHYPVVTRLAWRGPP